MMPAAFAAGIFFKFPIALFAKAMYNKTTNSGIANNINIV